MLPHLWIVFLIIVVLVAFTTQLLLFFYRDRKDYYHSLSTLLALFMLLGLVLLYRNYVLVNLVDVLIFAVYIGHGLSTFLNFLITASLVFFIHRFHGVKLLKFEWSVAIILILSAVLFISPFGVTVDVDKGVMFFYFGSLIAHIAYTIAFTYSLYFAVRNFRKLVSPKDHVLEIIAVTWIAIGSIENFVALVVNWQVREQAIVFAMSSIEYSGIPYLVFCLYFLRRLLLSQTDYSSSKAPQETAFLTEDSNTDDTSNYNLWQDAFTLTKREVEVAEQALLGLGNQEIAERLHVSLATIKTHLNKIFKKADVKSRFELAQKLNQLK